jgi:hypothetical protein
MEYMAEARKENDFVIDITPANNYIIATNNIDFWDNKYFDFSGISNSLFNFHVNRLIFYASSYNSYTTYNLRQANMLYGLYLVVIAQNPRILTDEVILLSFD